MKSKSILIILCYLLSLGAMAQTLFTYDNNKVDVKEFLRAYNKINTENTVTNKEKSIRDYLVLFINSKLKIHEAYEKKYDTMPAFREEVNNLRQQVMENYMTDPETYNRLAEEAFIRSQKDIQVQHIFIPFKTVNAISDSAVARLKIREAHMELSTGKKFEDVALKFSADPSATTNKGNLGYITVFSLPYQFENIVYALSPGQFSEPYKSKSGYHIFKNASERKAAGKIKVAQILLALPPGSKPEERKKEETLADSLYQRLMKGDDFAKLATRFSTDYVSAASGGQLPEFSLGTYDPAFENVAFSLPSNGAISKPFLTSHGIHIVKRISITPPPATNNKKGLDEIKLNLDKDPRINIARDVLMSRIKTNAGFTMADINVNTLKAFVDSAVENKQPPAGNTLKREMTLLNVGDLEKNIGDLITYVQPNRWLADGTGPKPFDQLMEEYKQVAVLDYYKKHMEEYNEDFRVQMNELKEGNLFFDIMMREVWNKAQSDSTGQAAYYNQHLKKYVWKTSADAIIFYCGTEETAKAFRQALAKKPADWKIKIEDYIDRSTADSGRFEWQRIPGLKKATPVKGMLTAIEKNKDDNSAAFAWVVKVYTQPSPKTFNEARGDVITDYQNELDNELIAALKKKYPVQVDEKVLQSIIR